MIVEENDILLPYSQHLQYIFVNFTKFTFQGTFIFMLRCFQITFIENSE
jgi:hypothetical protein